MNKITEKSQADDTLDSHNEPVAVDELASTGAPEESEGGQSPVRDQPKDTELLNFPGTQKITDKINPHKVAEARVDMLIQTSEKYEAELDYRRAAQGVFALLGGDFAREQQWSIYASKSFKFALLMFISVAAALTQFVMANVNGSLNTLGNFTNTLPYLPLLPLTLVMFSRLKQQMMLSKLGKYTKGCDGYLMVSLEYKWSLIDRFYKGTRSTFMLLLVIIGCVGAAIKLALNAGVDLASPDLIIVISMLFALTANELMESTAKDVRLALLAMGDEYNRQYNALSGEHAFAPSKKAQKELNRNSCSYGE